MGGAELNGKPKGGKTKMNGQLNGGSSSTRSSRARRKTQGTYAGWVFDKVLKVAVWYTIVTLAFRCPKTSDKLTDESPRICRPAIRTTEFVKPYVDPYYEHYIGPYVNKAQPYVDQVNQRVYQPGLAYYNQYAAPRVSQAQNYGEKQWQKSIKPQLEGARKQVGKQYDATLAPHVKKVQGVVQPYYDQVKTSANDIWELEIQPVYRSSAPYAQKFYNQGQEFAVKTAIPHAQYAGSTVWTFWSRQVWPRIRVLYGENVEPQLHRITERLARYKDGKRLEAEIKSMESESKASEALSTAESAASSISSTISDATSVVVPTPESTIKPIDQFRDDLKSWEAICAKAVEEGAEDLKERIQEISSHQISSQAESVGESRFVQLEETAVGVVESVKTRIQSVVADVPEDADASRLESAQEDVILAIRAAGQNIKTLAQKLREWHQAYNKEIDDLVDKALQSTLETIDGIRELRLTEIGRRYADKDLPHKEWSKYNDLKKATKGWRDDVEKIVNEHSGIKAAKEAGEEVENRGMSVAEDTAKELARLKDVAKWKLEAHDASDDFETRYIPPVAERARQQVVEKAEELKEAVVGSEQGTVESVTSVASEQAEKAASSVSSAADEAATKASEVVDSLTDSVTEAASQVSQAVAPSEKGLDESISSSLSAMIEDNALSKSLGPKAESILSEGSAKKEFASKSVESAASQASKSGLSVADDVSSSLSSARSEAESTASSLADSASSVGEKATKKVFAGANAQVLVEAREPILDDIVDDEASYSERLQSLFKDQAAAISQAVDDALHPVTTTQGAVESITSVASEQYESAVSAASSVLFGPGAASKGSMAAREQYESAVTAASYAIYGTPTLTRLPNEASAALDQAISGLQRNAQRVQAMASSQYNFALSEASGAYEAAKTELSIQISGTPEPAHQQILSSAEAAYSDAAAAANVRLQEVLAAVPVPTALFGTTQGPYDSISAIASSRLSEAISAASNQYSSAKIAVGVEPTPAHQEYLASAERAYYQGVGLAHERFSSFMHAASSAVGATPTTGFAGFTAAAEAKLNEAAHAAESLGSAASSAASSQLSEASQAAESLGSSLGSAASTALYGRETPTYESMASRASENWDALISRASENVYGAPPPFTGVVASHASEYAAEATKVAVEQYEAVQALFNELVHGKEPDFTDSMMSRLQSAYSTGAPGVASSASSLANEAYASASSVWASVFTPASTLDTFMDSFNEQLNSAVEIANAQIHGKPKGTIEQATEAAASAYSDAASQVSEAIYGSETGYAEAAQSSMADLAVSASKAMHEAIYGAPTGTLDAAQESAASVYSSLSSAAASQASAASSAFSTAYYGQQKGYAESMQSQISAAVASAQSRITAFASDASKGAADTISSATEAIESAASSVSSVASEVTEKVKDEL